MGWPDTLVVRTENNILISGEDGLKCKVWQSRLLRNPAIILHITAGYIMEDVCYNALDMPLPFILHVLAIRSIKSKTPAFENNGSASCCNSYETA